MKFYTLFKDISKKSNIENSDYIKYFDKIYLKHIKKKKYLILYHLIFIFVKYLLYCIILLICLIFFLLIFLLNREDIYYEIITAISGVCLSIHGIIFDVIGAILGFNKKHYINNQVVINLEIQFSTFIKYYPKDQKKFYKKINKILQNIATKENINMDIELLKSDIDTSLRINLKNNLKNTNIAKIKIVKYI